MRWEALERRQLLSGAPAQQFLHIGTNSNNDPTVSAAAQAAGINYAVISVTGSSGMLLAGSGPTPAQAIFTASDPNSDPRNGIAGLTVFHDKLYFFGKSGSVTGTGLYTTNGTAAGTTFVKRVGGPTTTFSDKSFVIGDRFCFFTQEGTTTRLMVSDGTPAGSDDSIGLPDNGTVPLPSQVIDGKVYFTITGNLWVTDGTLAGTRQLWTGTSQYASAANFVMSGGKLFFKYASGLDFFSRLYVANADGTSPARVSLPGNPNFETMLGDSLVRAGSSVVARAGEALFSTDGTVAGTLVLEPSTKTVSDPIALASGNALFRMLSGSSFGLWTTDGTPTGTRLINGANTTGSTAELFEVNGAAYLRNETNSVGLHFYQSDGTDEGTREVRYFEPSDAFRGRWDSLVNSVDGRVLTWVNASDGVQIWSLDPNVQTGSITGLLFTDVNRNGSREGFEPLRSTSYAYLDLNLNGVRDLSDPAFPAQSSKPYLATGVPAGHYRLRISDSSSVDIPVQFPIGGAYDIDLAPDEERTAHFIFASGTGAVVTGSVFDDTNGDGVQNATEAGVKSQTVYVDLNSNGLMESSEPNSVTAPDGTYGFSGLGAGSYVVRRKESTGVEQTTPPRRTGVPITLAADSVQTINFATTAVQPGSITGIVWTDWNHDGTRDAGDTPRANATVFFDINGDSTFTIGEPAAQSNTQGRFTFASVNPGSEVVRLRTSSTFIQTSPGGGSGIPVVVPAALTVTALEFLAYAPSEVAPTGRIAGHVWFDANGDGVQGFGDLPVDGRTIFIDADGNGAVSMGDSVTTTDYAGGFAFDHRAAGTYAVRQLLLTDWEQTLPAGSAAIAVTLATGQQQNAVEIGARPVLSAVVALDKTLVINGTPAADQFTISSDAGILTVTRQGSAKQFAISTLSQISFAGDLSGDLLRVSGIVPLPLAIGGNLSLAINTAARVQLTPVQATLSQLQVDGTIDLAKGQLTVPANEAGSWDGAHYTGVAGMIAMGFAGGLWNGPGIVSSAADGRLKMVGIASDNSTARLRCTYGGDANLDGKINVDDYTRIDFNVPLGTAGWFNGDFNYDGKINVDDYTIIDFNVGIQGAPMLSALAEVPSASTATTVTSIVTATPCVQTASGRKVIDLVFSDGSALIS